MPVTVILAALIAALLAGSPPPPPPPPPSLPLATVRVDVGEQRLVIELPPVDLPAATPGHDTMVGLPLCHVLVPVSASLHSARVEVVDETGRDRKSTRLNSSHLVISYAVFCLKKKKNTLANDDKELKSEWV